MKDEGTKDELIHPSSFKFSSFALHRDVAYGPRFWITARPQGTSFGTAS